MCRAQCEGGARPCPYVSCKYNLAIRITRRGKVREVYDVEEMADRRYTCALDAAAEGGLSVSEISKAMGINRRHVAQILQRAAKKLRAALVARGATECDDLDEDIELPDEPP